MLLQIDASRHDWQEGRGPWLSLVGGIDDATGVVPWATFREREDAQGTFSCSARWCDGVAFPSPSTAISTRSSSPPRSSSPSRSNSAVVPNQPNAGACSKELGVRLIRARSPQAKDRVERLWGTFQDRLCSELCLVGGATREEASLVLQRYLPRHNRRFGVPAAGSGHGVPALAAASPLRPSLLLQIPACGRQ